MEFLFTPELISASRDRRIDRLFQEQRQTCISEIQRSVNEFKRLYPPLSSSTYTRGNYIIHGLRMQKEWDINRESVNILTRWVCDPHTGYTHRYKSCKVTKNPRCKCVIEDLKLELNNFSQTIFRMILDLMIAAMTGPATNGVYTFYANQMELNLDDTFTAVFRKFGNDIEMMLTRVRSQHPGSAHLESVIESYLNIIDDRHDEITRQVKTGANIIIDQLSKIVETSPDEVNVELDKLKELLILDLEQARLNAPLDEDARILTRLISKIYGG